MSNENESNFKLIRSSRCLVCSKLGCDVCHIRSRGAGGPDDDFNIFPCCREHHSESHQIGIITFIRKYPSVAAYFDAKGWYILNGKLLNDQLLNE